MTIDLCFSISPNFKKNLQNWNEKPNLCSNESPEAARNIMSRTTPMNLLGGTYRNHPSGSQINEKLLDYSPELFLPKYLLIARTIIQISWHWKQKGPSDWFYYFVRSRQRARSSVLLRFTEGFDSAPRRLPRVVLSQLYPVTFAWDWQRFLRVHSSVELIGQTGERERGIPQGTVSVHPSVSTCGFWPLRAGVRHPSLYGREIKNLAVN